MKKINRYSISTGNVRIIAFCVLQKILLEYMYINIIFPTFEYYGFQKNFNLFRYVFSWIFYILVPLFTIKAAKSETLSKQAIAFLINIIYTPCLILYAYMENTPFIFFIVIYYTLMSITANYSKGIEIRVLTSRNCNLEKIVILIGYLLSFIILFVWIYYAKCHIQLNFTDVYIARSAARSFSEPQIINYARTMARSVIPLLAIYSLYKGKKIRFLYFVLIQGVQFFIDGLKSVVFIMVLGILSYFFIERYNRIIDKIPKFMSIATLLAIIEKVIFSTTNLSNMILRRVMFLPALMNYQYYEVAHSNGIDYYRQSLSILGKSKYDRVIARIVGLKYFGSETVNANNGLFADAYINLGFAGCIIMPILIVLIFKLIEKAGKKLPKSVWAVCVIQAFNAFTGSSFFTVLFSHGVALVIFILFNLSTNDYQKI